MVLFLVLEIEINDPDLGQKLPKGLTDHFFHTVGLVFKTEYDLVSKLQPTEGQIQSFVYNVYGNQYVYFHFLLKRFIVKRKPAVSTIRVLFYLIFKKISLNISAVALTDHRTDNANKIESKRMGGALHG